LGGEAPEKPFQRPTRKGGEDSQKESIRGEENPLNAQKRLKRLATTGREEQISGSLRNASVKLVFKGGLFGCPKGVPLRVLSRKLPKALGSKLETGHGCHGESRPPHEKSSIRNAFAKDTGGGAPGEKVNNGH